MIVGRMEIVHPLLPELLLILFICLSTLIWMPFGFMTLKLTTKKNQGTEKLDPTLEAIILPL
jgi:hypothetical protein